MAETSLARCATSAGSGAARQSAPSAAACAARSPPSTRESEAVAASSVHSASASAGGRKRESAPSAMAATPIMRSSSFGSFIRARSAAATLAEMAAEGTAAVRALSAAPSAKAQARRTAPSTPALVRVPLSSVSRGSTLGERAARAASARQPCSRTEREPSATALIKVVCSCGRKGRSTAACAAMSALSAPRIAALTPGPKRSERMRMRGPAICTACALRTGGGVSVTSVSRALAAASRASGEPVIRAPSRGGSSGAGPGAEQRAGSRGVALVSANAARAAPTGSSPCVVAFAAAARAAPLACLVRAMPRESAMCSSASAKVCACSGYRSFRIGLKAASSRPNAAARTHRLGSASSETASRSASGNSSALASSATSAPSALSAAARSAGSTTFSEPPTDRAIAAESSPRERAERREPNSETVSSSTASASSSSASAAAAASASATSDRGSASPSFLSAAASIASTSACVSLAVRMSGSTSAGRLPPSATDAAGSAADRARER
mmetsp:Transcript_35911/g.89640  ORF Transcript_35911/g.89640 Transcript_35911/m.89640 type:complete len:502 (+) Transcript_35911:176-1681(+)